MKYWSDDEEEAEAEEEKTIVKPRNY